MDPNGNLSVTIDELWRAVDDLRDGCSPVAPTATPSGAPRETPTRLPSATAPPEPSSTPTATEPQATATTTSGGAACGLTAQVDGDLVLLSWTNPEPASGYTQARLLRRLYAPVAGPNDAEADELYVGADVDVGDPLTALLPSVEEQERV